MDDLSKGLNFSKKCCISWFKLPDLSGILHHFSNTIKN